MTNDDDQAMEPETADMEKTAAEPATEITELRDKYLRLYAEFENYKRRVQKDKEELVKYGNESLLYEVLPVIDTLELALRHAAESASDSLVKGVENTLREFQRVSEKFGLVPIPALGLKFDPAVHHAMTQVERADKEDGVVIEEYRKGYLFRDKVLRPSLVAVSKRPAPQAEEEQSFEIPIRTESKEE